jgi:hypothetical protein
MTKAYIFIPWGKTFIPPILIVSSYYQEKGIEPVFIAREPHFAALSFLQIPFISFDEFDGLHSMEKGSRLLFIDDLNDFSFGNFSRAIFRNLWEYTNEPYTIDLMPDALSNVTTDVGVLDKFRETYKGRFNLKLGNFFTYGFVHHTVSDKYSTDNIINLSYSRLVNIFENSIFLTAISKNIISKLSNYSNIIFIPYRPWCTETFWLGKYSFGDVHDLIGLYDQLIEDIVRDKNIDKCLLLFRGDERFIAESKSVYDGISFKNKLILDDFDYPYSLSLEPLIYFLLKTYQGSIHGIALDSSTFDLIPYFLDLIEAEVSFDLTYGCDLTYFRDDDKHQSFINSLLRNRTHEFLWKLKSISNNVKNINISIDNIGPPENIDTIIDDFKDTQLRLRMSN